MPAIAGAARRSGFSDTHLRGPVRQTIHATIARMMRNGIAPVLTSVVCLLPFATPRTSAAQTITFEPTTGVQTFAVREPVLRLKPGATVQSRTFSRPGDYYDPATAGPWPGEVGPFYIEGATPNDTLVVRILRLRPNRDQAVSAVNPGGISAVAGDAK